MDLRHLINLLQELSNKRFYGTLQIEFRAGHPYLGLRTEKVIFDKPTLESQSVNQEGFAATKIKSVG